MDVDRKGCDLSEKEFTLNILTEARELGWMAAHVQCKGSWGSRRWSQYGNGFPDIVMVRNERLLLAELKSDTGRVKDEQIGWIEALRAATEIEAKIWRPSDRTRIIGTMGA